MGNYDKITWKSDPDNGTGGIIRNGREFPMLATDSKSQTQEVQRQQAAQSKKAPCGLSSSNYREVRTKGNL